MTTEEAVKHLTKELRDNPDFWNSYKANIAMAFYDEFTKVRRANGQKSTQKKVCPKCGAPQNPVNRKCWTCQAQIPPRTTTDIRAIANQAAENFLKLWCL